MIIGPDEENIKRQVELICKKYLDIILFLDFTNEPEKFKVADTFGLPSYREDLYSSSRGRSLCIAYITSKIYGLSDAVGFTGLFHDPGDVEE